MVAKARQCPQSCLPTLHTRRFLWGAAPEHNAWSQLMNRYLAGLLVALVFPACGEGTPDSPPPPVLSPDLGVDVAEVTFDAELGIRLDEMTRSEEGIYIDDIRDGRGAAASPGRQVVVEYRAWLPDGTLFEERPSPEGFGPSAFVLGENAPVPGLNAGIEGMRPGGVRRLVVPPEHGYGLVGRPTGVPAGSTLVFEVRLLRVSDPPPQDPDAEPASG
jgi:FKBP-type peptidyl-prolyl cis-trans isomerase FkpA